jgi:hypothetical protein
MITLRRVEDINYDWATTTFDVFRTSEDEAHITYNIHTFRTAKEYNPDVLSEDVKGLTLLIANYH